MSKYYYNNEPISNFLIYAGTTYFTSTYYYEGLVDLPYVKANPYNNFKITNTTFKYYKGSIDIATLFTPQYIEYNSANTYTNVNIPIWVNKMHCMIIGGGGSGYSQYTWWSIYI